MSGVLWGHEYPVSTPEWVRIVHCNFFTIRMATSIAVSSEDHRTELMFDNIGTPIIIRVVRPVKTGSYEAFVAGERRALIGESQGR